MEMRPEATRQAVPVPGDTTTGTAPAEVRWPATDGAPRSGGAAEVRLVWEPRA